MLDAAQHSIEAGLYDEARTIIGTAVERHRTTIRELRDLSFALEPVVLRDQGFGPALRALAEQVGTAQELRLDLDVEAAEERVRQLHGAVVVDAGANGGTEVSVALPAYVARR